VAAAFARPLIDARVLQLFTLRWRSAESLPVLVRMCEMLQPDVVVVDNTLPGSSGDRVLAKLQRANIGSHPGLWIWSGGDHRPYAVPPGNFLAKSDALQGPPGFLRAMMRAHAAQAPSGGSGGA